MTSIAVVTPSTDTYSETFIQAHIERLPAQVHTLSGGQVPTKANGKPLLRDSSFLQILGFRLRQQALGLQWNEEAKLLAAIDRFIHQNRVQAVLAEYGQTGVVVMQLCAQAGIPLVVHFHGSDAYRSDVLSRHKQDYPRLFGYASAIIAVSHHMYSQLLKLGAPATKLHYNPYGVDVSKFHGARPAEAPPTFVSVGRFVNKKGPLLTLLAFRQVLRAVPDAHLVMVGDGPLLETCKQFARAEDIAHAVEFRGAQPHSTVAVEMQGARAFVQHSLRPDDGDSEGTPVAILEASATGLPVISTRHAGIPDVIIHSETGLLADEGDVAGMAEAMIQLGNDAQLAASLGEAGRRRIQEHFLMETSIANLWAIIVATMKGA